MSGVKGKVFSTGGSRRSKSDLPIGKRLSELRHLAGLTQTELAKRLNIRQAALSKIESREDIHLSTLRKYLTALGATLQIDANFNANSSLVTSLKDAFDIEFANDDQFVFPIFEDDQYRSQRDFILSIKPQYSEQILAGSKRVELRRRFPVNVPSGTLAYIYSSSPTRALTGVATIEGVSKLSLDNLWESYSHISGIDKAGFDDYFSGLDMGFAIVFSDARSLRRSIELSELRDKFDFQPPQSFLYAKPIMREALKYERSDISH